MSDAEWLADVAAHGMVRPSFVPPAEIRGLRELTRYRKTQIRARAQEIQRLERLFQDAGIKLTSVASTVWSKSSRAMIEMLIAGQADPVVLAELAKGKIRAKIPALSEALENRWVTHHSALARQILAHIDFFDATIDTLTGEIVERLVPFQAAVTLFTTIPGVVISPPRRSSPRSVSTCPGSPPPGTSQPGPVSPPPRTSPPANADRPAPATAPATSATP